MKCKHYCDTESYMLCKFWAVTTIFFLFVKWESQSLSDCDECFHEDVTLFTSLGPIFQSLVFLIKSLSNPVQSSRSYLMKYPTGWGMRDVLLWVLGAEIPVFYWDTKLFCSRTQLLDKLQGWNLSGFLLLSPVLLINVTESVKGTSIWVFAFQSSVWVSKQAAARHLSTILLYSMGNIGFRE